MTACSGEKKDTQQPSNQAASNDNKTVADDGLFIMMYAMRDSQGNVAYSAPVIFESLGGEIITSVE